MDFQFSKEEIEPIIREVIIRFLIPKFRELGMPASGQWEQEVEARANEIWGMDYTEYLVDGRPPNTNDDPDAIRRWAVWAGSTFIKDWAEAKGVNIPPIAIAYKIARDGTDWYPEGSDLLDVLSEPEVIDFINEELGKIIIERVKKQFEGAFV